MIIEDGTGTGRKAKVTTSQMLQTDAVTVSREHYINHVNGEAFNIVFVQAPTAGDDCIFYFENSSDDDSIIEGVTLAVSGAAEVYVQINDVGTRNAAVDLVPANLNASGSKIGDGVFEQGADLDGGAATLAGGYEIERYVFYAATNSSHFNFEQDVMIQKNRTLTIWSSAIVTVNATLVYNQDPGEG